MQYEDSHQFAQKCDDEDELLGFRKEFNIPHKNGQPLIYFCGNSLGLQPKGAKKLFEEEWIKWSECAVEGHFQGNRPWMPYHKNFNHELAKIVGAQDQEVVAMNSLSVNLHLMMVSFYRPSVNRYKILCEADAFPSDQYAIETQVRFHGYKPDIAIEELRPDHGELISSEKILSKIDELGDQLALVLLPGVQYYTGQFFDIETITKAGHSVGATVGFDLAHAVGNLPLQLHDWGVDFAVWCSYKYLNSGPGAVGGAYVHSKYHDQPLPQFGGWWGHNEEERFLMKKGFDPIKSVDRWQLSNASVFNMIGHLASLQLFAQAGMERLRTKSLTLTGYLEWLIKERLNESVQIISPKDPSQRGCQLSLSVSGGGRQLFDRLTERGVIADWREPNVIRIAPVPLYKHVQ